MARLTEEMVIARSKQSDLSSIKKLNCWGAELGDVSLLRRMPNVEVLAFSINKIRSLVDFAGCRQLRELYVRKNEIRDLREIRHLRRLPALASLWLDENPCTRHPEYRMTVLRNLPQLEKLDNVAVEPAELQDALLRGALIPDSDDEGYSQAARAPLQRLQPRAGGALPGTPAARPGQRLLGGRAAGAGARAAAVPAVAAARARLLARRRAARTPRHDALALRPAAPRRAAAAALRLRAQRQGVRVLDERRRALRRARLAARLLRARQVGVRRRARVGARAGARAGQHERGGQRARAGQRLPLRRHGRAPRLHAPPRHQELEPAVGAAVPREGARLPQPGGRRDGRQMPHGRAGQQPVTSRRARRRLPAPPAPPAGGRRAGPPARARGHGTSGNARAEGPDSRRVLTTSPITERLIWMSDDLIITAL